MVLEQPHGARVRGCPFGSDPLLCFSHVNVASCADSVTVTAVTHILRSLPWLLDVPSGDAGTPPFPCP